jgi:hypothetical protein
VPGAQSITITPQTLQRTLVGFGPAEPAGWTETLATIQDITAPIQFYWSCQMSPDGTQPPPVIALSLLPAEGFGLLCEPENCTLSSVTCVGNTMYSRLFTFTPPTPGNTYSFVVGGSDPTGDPEAAWTVSATY